MRTVLQARCKREGINKVYRLAKARERKIGDITNKRWVKWVDHKVLIDEKYIKKRWK